VRKRSNIAAGVLAAAIAICALSALSPPGHLVGSQEGSWACTLSGAQALPPNSSLATGECEIHLRANRIHVKISWRGLSAPAMRVELHGPAGSNEEGPVLWTLTPGAQGREARSPVEGEFELDHTQGDLLREGLVYADIHTGTFQRGEIRGQMVRLAED
jgi:hypothetical protein